MARLNVIRLELGVAGYSILDHIGILYKHELILQRRLLAGGKTLHSPQGFADLVGHSHVGDLGEEGPRQTLHNQVYESEHVNPTN